MTIKKVREQVGMSQMEVSKLLGIPHRTLQAWEQGTRVPPEYVERLVAEKILSVKGAVGMTDKTVEIHEVYEQCKKVFNPSLDLLDELGNIEDKDEKMFYHLMTNFFMQKKQKQMIEDKVY